MPKTLNYYLKQAKKGKISLLDIKRISFTNDTGRPYYIQDIEGDPPSHLSIMFHTGPKYTLSFIIREHLHDKEYIEYHNNP